MSGRCKADMPGQTDDVPPDELPDLSQFGARDYVSKLCFLWLATVGPVSTNRELAEAIGCDETTVGQRLKRLADAGIIERNSSTIRIRTRQK